MMFWRFQRRLKGFKGVQEVSGGFRSVSSVYMTLQLGCRGVLGDSTGFQEFQDVPEGLIGEFRGHFMGLQGVSQSVGRR